MPETTDADDPTYRVTPADQLPATAELPQVASSTEGDREAVASRPVAVRERAVDERFTDEPPADAEPPRRRGRGAGCLFWLAGLIALILVVGVGAKITGLWPDIHNPFQKKTEDKSQPTLLLSIQDLSRFEAATGNFQVIIDQKDTIKYVPDFIYSNRVLFVAAGSVDAYVDFSNISEGDIKADPDTKSVEVHLPAPQLEDVNLDQDNTYVYDASEGLGNKVKDFFSGDANKMQKFYQLGEDRIAQAAQDSDLRQRAGDNTKKMLEQLLRSLGYTIITITVANP
jgi:hypothetical protein